MKMNGTMIHGIVRSKGNRGWELRLIILVLGAPSQCRIKNLFTEPYFTWTASEYEKVLTLKASSKYQSHA